MAEIRLTLDEIDNALPEVCLCCGAPASVWKQKTFDVAKKQESAGPADLLGFIPYVGPFVIIVLMMTKSEKPLTRKQQVIQAPFCSAHENHWLFLRLIIFGGLVAALIHLAFCFYLELHEEDGITFIGIGLAGFLFWGLLAAIAHETSVHAKDVTSEELTLVRVSDQFVGAVKKQRGW